MRILFVAVLFLSLISACGRFANEDQKQDQEKRVVVIAKQYNEIIWALGAEQDIVAVDVSSTYPPEIKDLPTIGYHRALSAEAVLAARPTMIIHDNNIGPEHVVRQLEDLKIPMKVFETSATDIPTTKALMVEMGQYFNKQERARELCDQLDKDMETALASVRTDVPRPKILVIHFGQASNIYLVITGNSTAAKIIDWAGGDMAVTGDRGMKQLSAEVVAASDPDIIFLTDFGYDRLGTREKIMELPGVAGTTAAKNGRIYRVEEHDLVYLGPRTGQIVQTMQKLIQDDGVE
ncbi:MAG: ABC transporter substrate-binding protein [Saprospiraceae bacterium]